MKIELNLHDLEEAVTAVSGSLHKSLDSSIKHILVLPRQYNEVQFYASNRFVATRFTIVRSVDVHSKPSEEFFQVSVDFLKNAIAQLKKAYPRQNPRVTLSVTNDTPAEGMAEGIIGVDGALERTFSTWTIYKNPPPLWDLFHEPMEYDQLPDERLVIKNVLFDLTLFEALMPYYKKYMAKGGHKLRFRFANTVGYTDSLGHTRNKPLPVYITSDYPDVSDRHLEALVMPAYE